MKAPRARLFELPDIFFDGVESGDLGHWPTTVMNLAEGFTHTLVLRDIDGNFIYLGQVFNEINGGLGGNPIVTLDDLYRKNEYLASTVPPYANQDADGDGMINSLDADALDNRVQ